MKKLMIILGLSLTIGMFHVNTVEAQQISVNVNINLDRQPAWGPAGYDYAEYYYIPDLNIYYDIDHSLFYYLDGRRWVSSIYLPVRFAAYDFYSLYKVVMNDIFNPWRFNYRHCHLYSHYCHNYSQRSIFYMNDHHYDMARHNAHAWVEPRYMDNRVYRSNLSMRNNGRAINDNRNLRSSTNDNRSSNRTALNSNRSKGSNNSNSNRTSAIRSNSQLSNRSNASVSSNRSSVTRNNNLAVNSSRSSRSENTSAAVHGSNARSSSSAAVNTRSTARTSNRTGSQSASVRSGNSSRDSNSSRSAGRSSRR